MIYIDNFLDNEDFTQIHNTLLNPEFPWFYNPYVDEANEGGDNFQFTHTFYKQPNGNNSEHISILNPLFEKLKASLLVRVKANMNPRSFNPRLGKLHRDVKWDECHTAIYYVNDNNGYTEFEDGTIIDSVENRVVIFRAKELHTGTNCTDANVRVLINVNYFT
tara:strand:+ start:27 stop:515 length:489 start_codon:yes stop_codon:yes gene_type:complete